MTNSAQARWRMPLLVRITLAVHAAAFAALLLHPQLWQWPLLALAVNHILLSAVGLWPRSRWLGPNWTSLPATSAARNEIALTIDDGPDPEVTPQVLDILDRYRAKATFFCIGVQAQRYPDLCREIIARGHAVENHSQHHRHNFSLLGVKGFARELQAAQQTLTAITGRRPRFFRAPAGLRNPFLDPVLAQLDLRLAAWSKRAFDTRNGDAAAVTHRLLSGLKPGAILLLHDGHCARTAQDRPVILDVLPALLEAAAQSGLRCITLTDALSSPS